MSRVGHVTRADVIPRRDGKSSGGGIVEYAEAAEAARAKSELHDSELGGRPIIVREDREDGPPGPRVASERTMASSRPLTTTGGNPRVYVGNLAWDVAWQGEASRAMHFACHLRWFPCRIYHHHHHPRGLGSIDGRRLVGWLVGLVFCLVRRLVGDIHGVHGKWSAHGLAGQGQSMRR